MIRDLVLSDIEAANLLLSEFNYAISTESFANSFFRTLVYIDNTIKGIIVYDFIYNRIEIEYIVVDVEYRKKGIGTKLLNELEKKEINNITLEVRESNKTAIEFYKKNGYEIKAVRPNYYGDEDGYLMLKEIGE